MNENGLVSIVIPVYNSKERLTKCLDSVVAQTYPNIEVIIVDDCSTDGSLEICREYETAYDFVHVYTKENNGVSSARNYGMSKAAGKYLQFADSDDMLEADACERLVRCMEQDGADLVIGGYYNEKEKRENIYPPFSFSGKGAFMKEFPALFSGYFLHVPWNKLYRKECVQAEFPENLSKGEDLLFNLQVFSQVQKISVLDVSLYRYYNVNDDSLSFRYREDAMEIEERLFQAVYDFYAAYEKKKEPLFLYRFYLEAVKNKFYALVGKSGRNRQECLRVIRNWVAKDSIAKIYFHRDIFGVKDRILLFLIHRKYVFLLYIYYRMAVRK